VHDANQNLGLDLGIDKLGATLGGWTLFSLFLSKYGDQEQIAEYLETDVR
jgi:hypothetical protein